MKKDPIIVELEAIDVSYAELKKGHHAEVRAIQKAFEERYADLLRRRRDLLKQAEFAAPASSKPSSARRGIRRAPSHLLAKTECFTSSRMRCRLVVGIVICEICWLIKNILFSHWA